MILNIMANDDQLYEELKEQHLFDDIKSVFNMDELTDDCIIISDEFLPYKDLQDLKLNENQTAFYMIQSQYGQRLEKSIKILCDSKGIILIPPRLTVNQIVQIIRKNFNESLFEKSNVVAFLSTVSNIGTTSTCLSVARSLEENTKAKVGVLLLNAWDHGTYQLSYKGEYLDDLKVKLHNQVINSKEEFLSYFHMEKENQLYFLGGNRYTKIERLYTKEEINYLINLSKKYFDVVLLDLGSHFDNALMVQGLHESDMRFLIVNQQPKTINRFNLVYDEILYPLNYKKEDFLTVINQFKDKAQLSTPKSIANELDMLNITTIYEVDEPLISEIETKTLYDLQDSVYQGSILNIVKSISAHASLQLEVEDTSQKKKRFFGIG